MSCRPIPPRGVGYPCKVAFALTVIALLVGVSTPMAAETTVGGSLYSHWMMDVSKGANCANEFALSRAYLTVTSKLSNYTSVRITFDMKETDGRYDVILKYAYLDWKPAFARRHARIRFGLQPTQYIDYMNKLWARRYLEKTISDQRGFLTSADLGASVMVNFAEIPEKGAVSVTLFNGTSYTDTDELNKQKDVNIVAWMQPLRGVPRLAGSALVAQLYTGTQNRRIEDYEVVDTTVMPPETVMVATESRDWRLRILSVGGLLAYDNTVAAGFDVNFATRGRGPKNEEVRQTGFSFHATAYLGRLVGDASLARTLSIFGRLDLYDPDADHGIEASAANDTFGAETSIIVGVECAPVQGFRGSLNFRSTSFEDKAKRAVKALYVNTMLRF